MPAIRIAHRIQSTLEERAGLPGLALASGAALTPRLSRSGDRVALWRVRSGRRDRRRDLGGEGARAEWDLRALGPILEACDHACALCQRAAGEPGDPVADLTPCRRAARGFDGLRELADRREARVWRALQGLHHDRVQLG